MASSHTVLVTGVSGFVGGWLVAALSEASAFGAVRIVTAGRNGNCNFETDITQRGETDRLIREVQPTAVVHLAALAAPGAAQKDPSAAWETNFRGTQNLAWSIIAEKSDCRLVFAGSSEAYGQSFADANGAPVTEDMALKPISTYGATKAAAEIMLGQLSFDGLRVVRFRPFNHTGPAQSDAYAVPAFASQIARIMGGNGKPVIKVGNLAARRDFIDVRDVVRAYTVAALDLERQIDGMVFNLASGTPVPIGTILRTLIETSKVDITIEESPERMRPVDILSACGNAQAAAEHLGWTPALSLDQTLRDVLQDWQSRISLN